MMRPAPRQGAKRYPTRMPEDYSGQDLRGRDFEGQDLSFANLRGANLRGANLSGAKLSGGDFTDANLAGAFRRPGISRADMEGDKGLGTVKGLLD